MTIAAIDIYSIFFYAKIVGKKKKDANLHNRVPPIVWDRAKPITKEACKKLWNKYENNFFTLDQLRLYTLYEYLFRSNVSPINIDKDEIKNVDCLFSDVQFQKDKYLLKLIKEKHKLKNISSLFQVTEEGESVAYDLTKKKLISPMVYINYFDKIKDIKNDKEEYQRFLNVIRKIKEELKKE